jgi:hypothetical protein
MSAIYFHGEHDTVSVRGSERAYMGVLTGDILVAAIGDLDYARDWLPPMLPPDCYGLRGTTSNLRLYLRSGYDSVFIVDGESIPTWLVALNTAWVIGGDPMRLLARLHGQCEIHCWVEGVNRQWLAGIVRRGLASGLYRSGQGWEQVADFLEDSADGPIVCSFSVCDPFPDFDCLPADHPLRLSEDDHEDVYDAYCDLPDKWTPCMAGLRAADPTLELRPDTWEDYRFAGGHSMFSLREKMRAQKPPLSTEPADGESRR